MINKEAILLGAVFAPIAAALVIAPIGRFSGRLRNFLSLAAVLLSLICNLKLLFLLKSGQIVNFTLNFPLGLNFILVADGLAVFMAIVSSLISAIIIWYSFTYIIHYPHQDEYYAWVLLFVGSMMGLVYSQHLIYLYIFWELTAISSYRLIGFFRKESDLYKADKALLVTVGGALLMLTGFIWLYSISGSFELPVIKESLAGKIPFGVVALILAGILAKSAILPFHTWLLDAGIAPSPVTALLHAAVLVKIGVFVFCRIFVANITLSNYWYFFIGSLAALSTLVSAGMAFKEYDIKRIIAYSTVSQIGYILFGFTCMNLWGVSGALFYILTHGVAKAGLFLCAGIIEQNTHTKDIRKLGGLRKNMPWTAVSFLICAASVMGIPPLGGFFGKFMLFSAAFNSQQRWLVPFFLVGAFITMAYLIRLFNAVFMGEASNHNLIKTKEGSRGMVLAVTLLAFLSLVSGIGASFPLNFISEVAKGILK